VLLGMMLQFTSSSGSVVHSSRVSSTGVLGLPICKEVAAAAATTAQRSHSSQLQGAGRTNPFVLDRRSCRELPLQRGLSQNACRSAGRKQAVEIKALANSMHPEGTHKQLSS